MSPAQVRASALRARREPAGRPVGGGLPKPPSGPASSPTSSPWGSPGLRPSPGSFPLGSSPHCAWPKPGTVHPAEGPSLKPPPDAWAGCVCAGVRLSPHQPSGHRAWLPLGPVVSTPSLPQLCPRHPLTSAHPLAVTQPLLPAPPNQRSPDMETSAAAGWPHGLCSSEGGGRRAPRRAAKADSPQRTEEEGPHTAPADRRLPRVLAGWTRAGRALGSSALWWPLLLEAPSDSGPQTESEQSSAPGEGRTACPQNRVNCVPRKLRPSPTPRQ